MNKRQRKKMMKKVYETTKEFIPDFVEYHLYKNPLWEEIKKHIN